MYIRSTGLGKTLLTAKVNKMVITNLVPATLEPPQMGHNEPERILLELQITHPVTWIVRAFIEPPDLIDMIKAVFKNPMLMWKVLTYLVAYFFSRKDR